MGGDAVDEQVEPVGKPLGRVRRRYVAHIFGPTLVAGAGVSLMLLSVTLTAATGVDSRDAGASSGLLHTFRQFGEALGLAVLSTVAATVTTHAARHAGPAVAVVHGYHVALW